MQLKLVASCKLSVYGHHFQNFKKTLGRWLPTIEKVSNIMQIHRYEENIINYENSKDNVILNYFKK